VIGLEIIFEHRVYLPSMLVVMLAVLWLQKILPPKRLQIAALGAVLSCLVFWTYERNSAWSDTATLLTDSVSKSPGKARPHLNLGIVLKNNKRLDEAIIHYQKALVLDPNYAEAYYNLGNAYILSGDMKKAAANYFMALALTPYDVDTHYNLGYTLGKLWRFDEAIYHYSMAIKLKPDFVKARRELAELQLYMQKLQKRKPNKR
jgi:tetratricopeptide (TPR) repeat protein